MSRELTIELALYTAIPHHFFKPVSLISITLKTSSPDQGKTLSQSSIVMSTAGPQHVSLESTCCCTHCLSVFLCRLSTHLTHSIDLFNLIKHGPVCLFHLGHSPHKLTSSSKRWRFASRCRCPCLRLSHRFGLVLASLVIVIVIVLGQT